MNSKELIFSVLVVAGLLFTGSTFLKQNSFDCYQPIFSNRSSCSLVGGSCIKFQAKAGAFGLWDQFNNLIIQYKEEGIRIQCAPNCYIDIGSREMTESDTVYQPPPEAVEQ